MPSTYILGLSAYYHDAAASLLRDGHIVAAAQEERFSRRKHDAAFPADAIRFCLDEAGIRLTDVSRVVFYDKPLVKFERLLETYLSYAPRGLRSFMAAMPLWLKEKLFLKVTLRKALADLGGCNVEQLPELRFAGHHQSHAASAFFPSPFASAAVLCLDGVGEWATTSVWHGRGSQLEPLWEIDFPHSLGLLYSAFTYYAGFRVNSGEYKLMGLAPYGEPRFRQLILDHLLDLKSDGTFRLNMEYFNYCTGLTMTNERFARLLGEPVRVPESELTQHHMDVAASIQAVTEEVVMRLARTVQSETGEHALCLAGGVALNCVANGKLLRQGPFRDLWIQPAAGDAGGALGAALVVWYQQHGGERIANGADAMRGAFLGPRFEAPDITAQLDAAGAVYERYDDDRVLLERVAGYLDEQNVVGWFNGRMEFGPRALGARSILGDARSKNMQSVMNLKIKYRESFRPFAPSVLAEHVADYFDLDRPSPYMLIVAPVAGAQRLVPEASERQRAGIDRLDTARSSVPAVTHVDYSARVQTVHADTNPRYHALLTSFYERTGCPLLVNTSFNVRGEPVVCTPQDAYRCFMRTEMDYLVIDGFLLAKSAQPPWREPHDWQSEFEPD